MIESMIKNNILISGGGSGGHIFPALAIADKIKEKNQNLKIIFVGAKGKMEMKKVPSYGYKIIPIPISGFQRNNFFKNLFLPIKLIVSLISSLFIIIKYKPVLVIGTGGYASGPLLFVSSILNIPSIIQEQNSYPGITNKILSKFVDKICVAYENMDKFFPKSKIVFTGNPIRSLVFKSHKQIEANSYFKLPKSNFTVLSIGGSLGAFSINNAIKQNISFFSEKKINLIWQTGKTFYNEAKRAVAKEKNIALFEFIKDMDYAYSAADIIISRAGAIAISELTVVGKPVILIPSPNVAENHQYKNAQSLVNNNAALLVNDDDTNLKIVNEINKLILNKELRKNLSSNIKKLEKNQATDTIFDIARELSRDV